MDYLQKAYKIRNLYNRYIEHSKEADKQKQKIGTKDGYRSEERYAKAMKKKKEIEWQLSILLDSKEGVG